MTDYTHPTAHGKCDDICDASLEYESGMDGLECTPKKNAGTWCSNDQQCLFGKCNGNYCCSDAAVGQGCSICTAGSGACSTKKRPGESCSSDSDCYHSSGSAMCAGGVCCTSQRSREGMANCTRCGSYQTEMMGEFIDCVECAAGTQLTDYTHPTAHGKCDDICDASLKSGMDGLECTPKKNAGTWCSNDQQCLFGKCNGNYCCSDAAVGQGCSICTAGSGACSTVKSPGESCSSDSDCYHSSGSAMCAGGVCCTSQRSREGMANCTVRQLPN